MNNIRAVQPAAFQVQRFASLAIDMLRRTERQCMLRSRERDLDLEDLRFHSPFKCCHQRPTVSSLL